MTKNAKTVTMFAIAAIVLVVLVFAGRDLWLCRQPVIHCSDGSHPTVDMRDFTTQYWAYSAKLEVTVSDKAKISTHAKNEIKKALAFKRLQKHLHGKTSGPEEIIKLYWDSRVEEASEAILTTEAKKALAKGCCGIPIFKN